MSTELEQYKRVKTLGKGAYATIYLAIHEETGRKVAIKEPVCFTTECGIPAWELRELDSLQRLEHPNIVRLLEFSITPGKTSLVLEYMENDLHTQLSSKPFSDTQIKSVLHQLLSGVAYMHASGVLHRDLKPQNILIDKQFNVKIADFGLSRAMPLIENLNPRTLTVQSLWYRAPEVLLANKNYDFAIDMWSVGCIFAELLMRKPLFMGISALDQLSIISTVLGLPGIPSQSSYLERATEFTKFLGQLPAITRDLLQRMLQVNSSARVKAADALSHPFFAAYKP